MDKGALPAMSSYLTWVERSLTSGFASEQLLFFQARLPRGRSDGKAKLRRAMAVHNATHEEDKVRTVMTTLGLLRIIELATTLSRVQCLRLI